MIAISVPQLTTRRYLLTACAGLLYWLAAVALAEPVRYDYEIIAERARSDQLFTQGLVLHQGVFYESSGRYGQSRLVSYARDLDDGATHRFLQHRSLPRRYFAEGLAHRDDRLYMLTWQENTLKVFDRNTFAPLQRLSYSGEGWGLTHNGEYFIRSDGSHRLYFHSFDDFTLLGTLEVQDHQGPVSQLNELEYLNGRVWANIFCDHRLVEIDLETGQITGYLDLSALVERVKPNHPEQVLNGVAYDPDAEAFWVTGKLWPTLFLIRIKAPD